jgi:hypothetical protein
MNCVRQSCVIICDQILFLHPLEGTVEFHTAGVVQIESGICPRLPVNPRQFLELLYIDHLGSLVSVSFRHRPKLV